MACAGRSQQNCVDPCAWQSDSYYPGCVSVSVPIVPASTSTSTSTSNSTSNSTSTPSTSSSVADAVESLTYNSDNCPESLGNPCCANANWHNEDNCRNYEQCSFCKDPGQVQGGIATYPYCYPKDVCEPSATAVSSTGAPTMPPEALSTTELIIIMASAGVIFLGAFLCYLMVRRRARISKEAPSKFLAAPGSPDVVEGYEGEPHPPPLADPSTRKERATQNALLNDLGIERICWPYFKGINFDYLKRYGDSEIEDECADLCAEAVFDVSPEQKAAFERAFRRAARVLKHWAANARVLSKLGMDAGKDKTKPGLTRQASNILRLDGRVTPFTCLALRLVQAATVPAQACSICGKVFSTRNNVIRHMHGVHQKQINYRCKVCGKGFYRRTGMKDHVRVHSGAKPFECPLCGRGFSVKSNMTKHHRDAICQRSKKGSSRRRRRRKPSNAHARPKPDPEWNDIASTDPVDRANKPSGSSEPIAPPTPWLDFVPFVVASRDIDISIPHDHVQLHSSALYFSPFTYHLSDRFSSDIDDPISHGTSGFEISESGSDTDSFRADHAGSSDSLLFDFATPPLEFESLHGFSSDSDVEISSSDTDSDHDLGTWMEFDDSSSDPDMAGDYIVPDARLDLDP